MAAMSNYLENKAVDHFVRGIAYSAPTTVWVALLVASPDDTNSFVEVSGGSYARVAVACNTTNWSGTQGAGTSTVSTGTTGTTSNNIPITFPAPTANWGTIVGVALIDAPTGGNSLFQGTLSESLTVNSGSPAPSFPAGAFSLQLDT